jgi:hypothetical protein
MKVMSMIMHGRAYGGYHRVGARVALSDFVFTWVVDVCVLEC